MNYIILYIYRDVHCLLVLWITVACDLYMWNRVEHKNNYKSMCSTHTRPFYCPVAILGVSEQGLRFWDEDVWPLP